MTPRPPSTPSLRPVRGTLSELQAVSAASFEGTPGPLLPSLAEVHAVVHGIKPACRLTFGVDGRLGASLAWLRDLGLSLSLSQPPPEQLGYGPVSTTRRAALLRTPKVRVYAARTARGSRALYRLEAERYDYTAFGLALGYPSCCVETAAAADRSEWDARFAASRQTNLTAAGLLASNALEPACNHLLLESSASAFGPVSAISHYPCRLDCPASAERGREVLAMAASLWPAWHTLWLELLHTPVLYWSDADWPPELWDEYAGLVLIGAKLVTPLSWTSGVASFPLGSGLTPAGPLPAAAAWGTLAADGVVLGDGTGSTLIPKTLAGSPYLLDWAGGSIRSADEKSALRAHVETTQW
jgi:hypothetical protein